MNNIEPHQIKDLNPPNLTTVKNEMKSDPYFYIDNYIKSLSHLFLFIFIGIVLLSCSKYLKPLSNILVTLAIVIILYGLMFGLKNANDFKNNLLVLKERDIRIPEHKQLGRTEDWVNLTYLLLIVIILFVICYFFAPYKM